MDARNFMPISAGDAAPPCIAFKSDGKLFASEEQAGRPIAVLLASSLEDPRTLSLLAALESALPQLQGVGCDAILLTRQDVFAAFRFHQAHPTPIAIAGQADLFITSCGFGEALPSLLLIDRNWRVVSIHPCICEPADSVSSLCSDLSYIPREETKRLDLPAPVLILPNLIERSLCEELIALYETGGNYESGITSVDKNMKTFLKFDPARKVRRDHWIANDTALHKKLLHIFETRLFPEIKKVFQVEVTCMDRLLISCYPEHTGLFKRHRDNRSPTVRFRQFALSLNLNTGAYSGGELIFPEYSPHLYSPPACGAMVFSASLLHEVTRITQGQRYVLLSFLYDAVNGALAQSQTSLSQQGA
jgi:hypothetical protein